MSGVLAGLILLGVAALHHPSIRARVLDRARVYAEREFHIALRASNLSYSLFSRSVELRDVRIASTSATEPLLEADRVEVVFGRGILLGRPAITRVSLSRPRVTLVRDRDGTVNLPPPPKNAEPRSEEHTSEL